MVIVLNLLKKLNPGSSVSNPIDFLATGTAEQLGEIIDFCETYNAVDAMVVVFGSPGLFNVKDVYEVLDTKMNTCKKPIFPVLPSLINAEKEIKQYYKQYCEKIALHFWEVCLFLEEFSCKFLRLFTSIFL